MWDSKLVNDSIFFATKKHDGQKMKHPENMPYMAHCFGVSMCAIKYASMLGGKVDWNLLVCSAILHDTLEDTNTTFEELENLFGTKIAEGVFALTKDESIEKEKQMLDCIQRIKKQPKEIAIVKLSDRFFNLRERVPAWEKEKQEAYLAEGKLIFNELGEFCKPLKTDFEKQINKY